MGLQAFGLHAMHTIPKKKSFDTKACADINTSKKSHDA